MPVRLLGEMVGIEAKYIVWTGQDCRRQFGGASRTVLGSIPLWDSHQYCCDRLTYLHKPRERKRDYTSVISIPVNAARFTRFTTNILLLFIPVKSPVREVVWLILRPSTYIRAGPLIDNSVVHPQPEWTNVWLPVFTCLSASL
jgi:hypothetical protein